MSDVDLILNAYEENDIYNIQLNKAKNCCNPKRNIKT